MSTAESAQPAGAMVTSPGTQSSAAVATEAAPRRRPRRSAHREAGPPDAVLAAEASATAEPDVSAKADVTAKPDTTAEPDATAKPDATAEAEVSGDRPAAEADVTGAAADADPAAEAGSDPATGN